MRRHSSSLRGSPGQGGRQRSAAANALMRSYGAGPYQSERPPHRSNALSSPSFHPKGFCGNGFGPPRGTLRPVAIFPFRNATGRPDWAIAAMTPADLKTHPLVFSCPNTGLPLITHILIQSGDAPAIQAMRFTVRCACCRAAHELDGADCRNNRPRRWRHSAPALSKGA
jgi:hypothetical protein